MRRLPFAVAALVVGSAGILLLWSGFGDERHVHGEQASAVIMGAVAVGDVHIPTGSDPTVPTGSGEHATHLADSAGTAEPAVDVTAPTAGPVGGADPDTSAADRRQVTLDEAAGGGVAPSSSAITIGPGADTWLDPEAAGVNEGIRKQAAGVDLQPAPVVDPSQVLPTGLVNGCVAGYGHGVQCLPQTPPSHAGHGSGQDMSMFWTCAEASALLPDGIAVDTPGTDPLGLDANGDGTACGQGDR